VVALKLCTSHLCERNSVSLEEATLGAPCHGKIGTMVNLALPMWYTGIGEKGIQLVHGSIVNRVVNKMFRLLYSNGENK